MISYEFILTSLIVVLIPGVGVIYTISTGISGSKKDSIIAAFACTVGIIPHILASIIGISVIFHTSALIFRFIKMTGIIYLLYLGWAMIREKGGMVIDEGTKEKNKIQIIIKGVLINLLNPKLTLFFFSFLPQFALNNGNGYMYQMFVLGGIFMTLTFGIFSIYGILANHLKNSIINSSRLTAKIQQSLGVIFIGLAAKLLFQDSDM